MSDVTKEEKESTDIVRRAGILTSIWLFCAVLAYVAKASHPNFNVSEIKLNEWGDFIAGFTSPLAFGWLVVAVFIQRNELRAQIRELEASRQALEQQVIESRRSVEQFLAQTEIAREQISEIKNENNRRLIERKILGWCNIYYNLSKGFPYLYSNITLSGSDYVERSYRTAFDSLPASDDVKEALVSGNAGVACREICLELAGTARVIEESLKKEIKIEINRKYISLLQKINNDIIDILEDYKRYDIDIDRIYVDLKVSLSNLIEIYDGICEVEDRTSKNVKNDGRIFFKSISSTDSHIVIKFMNDRNNSFLVELPVTDFGILHQKFAEAGGIFDISSDQQIVFIDDRNLAIYASDLEKQKKRYIWHSLDR